MSRFFEIDRHPHYAMVPKDLDGNLVYRRKLLEWADGLDVGKDPIVRRRRREQIWRACRRDPLFLINSFFYIIEPRGESAMPWITYPFQDEAIMCLVRSLENAIKGDKCDVIQSKSRDMGASWCCVAVPVWRCDFFKNFSCLMLSRESGLVDSDDPKSLFWKMDFIHKRLPPWLAPHNVKRIEMLYRNIDRESYIKGGTTHEFSGVADRTTMLLIDEMSLMREQAEIWKGTRDVSRCRVANSTIRPRAKTFIELIKSQTMTQSRLHWTLHPDKVKGLYRSKAGVLEIIDKSFVFPAGYKFKLDGRTRSPWYDSEEPRCATRAEMDTEVDMLIDSGTAFCFDSETIDRLILTTRPTMHCGELEPVEGSATESQFNPTPWIKPFSLWVPLVGHARPPTGRYGIGIDVGAGVGATPSVGSVWRLDEGRKVASYATNALDPKAFADAMIRLAWFFTDESGRPAMLKWEANGSVGEMFGQQIVRRKFSNVWMHRKESGFSQKISDLPGWRSNNNTKPALFRDYSVALRSGHAINPCRISLEECRQYIFDDGGVPVHRHDLNSEDPLSRKTNHGDHVVADALGHSLCDKPELPTIKRVPNLATIEGKRLHWEAERKKKARLPWYNKPPYAASRN